MWTVRYNEVRQTGVTARPFVRAYESKCCMVAVEQYLKPELASQIKRLDLRAQMIVRGFLQGMHASPYHGFSVEFSEHRRYAHGRVVTRQHAALWRSKAVR